MKVLKVIGWVLLVLAVVFVLLMFIAPEQYHIERSVVIDAPKDVVMEQTVKFENFKEWEPWGKADPDMEVNIEGPDGEVGAVYTWKGNDDVGSGTQELVAKSDNRADIKLTFTAPFASEDKTYYEFKEVEDGTKVNWGMDTEIDKPMNVMMWLMGMKGMIEKSYDEGLSNLKARVESMPKKQLYRGYEVNQVPLDERTYAGIRDEISFAEMEAFYEDNFAALAEKIETSGVAPAGAPSSLYYMWDEESQRTELMVAFPLAPGSELPGTTSENVSGNAYHIAHQGDYEGLETAHYAMDDFMKSNNVSSEDVLVIEEYAIGPETESDTTKWLTHIYYVIQ